MPVKSSSKVVGFAVAACVLCLSMPAWAGFQWAPVKSSPAEDVHSPVVVAAPSAAPAIPNIAPTIIQGQAAEQTAGQAAGQATDSPEVVAPLVISGEDASRPAAPVVISEAPAPSQPEPIVPAVAEKPIVAPVAAAPKAAAPAKPDSDIVRGFANRVPLTVALRQLLPPAYSFSVDQDVDMGILISFKGGKPWRTTLSSALQPVGLALHEQGQMIVIGRMETAASEPMLPPVTEPEAKSVTADVATDPSNPVIFDNAPPPPMVIATAKPDSNPVPVQIPNPAPADQDAINWNAPASAPVVTPAVSPAVSAAVSNVTADIRAEAPVPAVKPAIIPPKPVEPVKHEVPEMPVVNAPVEAPTLITTSAATTPVAVTEMWSADRGDSLRKVLTAWSHRAHVELEWLAEYDYPLQATVNLTGTFEDAVRNLLSGFEGAHPQPVGQLHSNSGMGQMVLVVRTRGNTNKD